MNNIIVLEVKFNFNGDENRIFPAILRDESNMILIDCGYPDFMPLIQEAAKEKGIDINELTKIIITHHDFDHMGALAEFKRAYPHIQILSSLEEERYISGKEKSLRLQQAEAIYDKLSEEHKEGAMSFHRLLESIENAQVDICVRDHDSFSWCGGAEIIATPGHMPGHSSIYIKESKTLIPGDALVIENGELAIANPQYTMDILEAKKSINKLLHYEIDRIICYHGGIYTGDIKAELMKLGRL